MIANRVFRHFVEVSQPGDIWQSWKKISTAGPGSPGRFHARPGVRRKDLGQRGMFHQLMRSHDAGDALTDLLEPDPQVTKGLDGHFVGSVEDGGHRAAELPRPARQV